MAWKGRRQKKRSSRRKVSFRRTRKARVTRSVVPFASISRPPSGVGFPRIMKLSHRYVENLQASFSAGSPAVYRYSCNGLFDPRTASGGHQPMYFDTMAALYHHYRVIGSKITIRGTPPATTAGLSSYVALTTDSDTFESQLNIASLVEEGVNRSDVRVTGGINPSPVYMTKTWSAKKYFGKRALTDDDFQGDINANPAEQTYFKICLESSDSTTTALCYFLVQIDYIVIWDELQQFSPS